MSFGDFRNGAAGRSTSSRDNPSAGGSMQPPLIPGLASPPTLIERETAPTPRADVSPSRASAANSDQERRVLAERVKTSIVAVASNVASLQRLVGNLGTVKDTPEMRERLHAVNHSTQELVKQTTADLKSLSASLSSASPSIHHPSSSDDAALRLRKLEQQKLSKDFQVVLARFQQVQRQSAEKSRDYVAKARAHTVHQDQDQDDGDLDAPLIQEESRRQQELMQLDREIEYNEGVIADREQSLVEIEHAIQEVNEIFRDLGTLVSEQQGMIDNIESNIESTATRTGDANIELQQADRYQRRARNRMCCLLLIVAIVMGVIILVVVLTH